MLMLIESLVITFHSTIPQWRAVKLIYYLKLASFLGLTCFCSSSLVGRAAPDYEYTYLREVSYRSSRALIILCEHLGSCLALEHSKTKSSALFECGCLHHHMSTWHHSCDKCSQAYPVFHRFSISMYYTGCKPNNKNKRGLRMRLIRNPFCQMSKSIWKSSGKWIMVPYRGFLSWEKTSTNC